MSWGLPSTTKATAAVAAALAAASVRARSSHPARTRAARIRAITADSWLTSRQPASTAPRITAWPMDGLRRSRTAASSVTGRNAVPYAMLMWYQSW